MGISPCPSFPLFSLAVMISPCDAWLGSGSTSSAAEDATCDEMPIPDQGAAEARVLQEKKETNRGRHRRDPFGTSLWMLRVISATSLLVARW